MKGYTEPMKKSRPTLGLAMIMKDEIEDLERILNECGDYFDKFYITATNKKLHTALKKKIADKHPAYKQVELSYFEWIDHFGKARLYNHSQIKTDYWMCIDPDDEIEGAENLSAVIDYMIEKNLDATVFPYETPRRTNLSEPVTIGWRERVIRTASGLKWSDKPIHENIYIEGDTDMLVKSVVVKHRRTAAEKLQSGDRNKKILEKAWAESPSAEIAKYLGATLMDFGDYEGAIEKMLYSAENYESNAEKFRAWKRVSDCYALLGRYDAAIVAAGECIAIDPDHPGPWYQKFTVYQAAGMHSTAMYCAENALTKRDDGELAILLGSDPSQYEYRGPFSIAQAYLSLGKVERAYELYQHVKKVAPQYIEEQSAITGTQWSDAFEQAYDDFKKKSP